jgi:hypothetical protein
MCLITEAFSHIQNFNKNACTFQIFLCIFSMYFPPSIWRRIKDFPQFFVNFLCLLRDEKNIFMNVRSSHSSHFYQQINTLQGFSFSILFLSSLQNFNVVVERNSFRSLRRFFFSFFSCFFLSSFVVRSLSCNLYSLHFRFSVQNHT